MVTKSSSKANASARQKQTVIVHVGDTSKKRKPRRKRAAKPRGQAPPPSFGPVIRIPPTVIMQPSAPPLAPMGAPQQAQQILEQPAVNVPGFAKAIEDNKPIHKQVAEMGIQTEKPKTAKQLAEELRAKGFAGLTTPEENKKIAKLDYGKQYQKNMRTIYKNPEEHVAAKQQLKSLAEQAVPRASNPTRERVTTLEHLKPLAEQAVPKRVSSPKGGGSVTTTIEQLKPLAEQVASIPTPEPSDGGREIKPGDKRTIKITPKK